MRSLLIGSALVAALVLGPGGVAPAHAQAVNYFGFLDYADCSGASGWVYSPQQIYTAQQVQLFVDGNYAATVTANWNRPDVAAAGYGTGYYGYGWTYPAPIYGTHTIRARAVGAGSDLFFSPRTITCSPPQVNYHGFLDDANCTGVSGWVWSPDLPSNTRQNVEILIDGALATTITANLNRPDVAAAGFGDGYYGFAWNYPTPMVGNHSVAARVAGTTSNLFWSPRSTSCAAATTDNSTGSVKLQRTMIPGESTTPMVTMTNTGTSTWTTGRYALKPQDGTSAIGLGTSIGPGGSYTFTAPAIPASTPGTWTRAWRMIVDGIGFGATASVPVVVSTVPTVYAIYYFNPPALDPVFLCSATMIGDKTLLSAAHCGYDGMSVLIYRRDSTAEKQFFDYAVIHNYPGFAAEQFVALTEWSWLPDLAVVTLHNPHPEAARARIRHNSAPVAFTTAGFGRSYAHPAGEVKHFGFNSTSGQANWYFRQMGVPTVGGVPDDTAIVCSGDSGGAVFDGQDVNAPSPCLTGVMSYNIPGPGGPTGVYATLTPPQCQTGHWFSKVNWVWVTDTAADPTIGDC